MEKLTVRGICRILRACHKSGVEEFTFGELKVSFKGLDHPFRETSSRTEEVSFSENQELVSTEALLREEVLTKEDRLAQLELEDPVEFERLMLSGDLDDSKVGAGADEGYSGAE